VSADDSKLITCVLPKGGGLPLLAKLSTRFGIQGANVHHARGVGRSTPLGRRGFGEAAERDVVNAVVPASVADEVFEFVYFEAGIHRAHGGMLYLRPLLRASRFEVPELREES
jgi:hypothetical protein